MAKVTRHKPVIWEKQYLTALSQTGNWTLSAQMAGINKSTARERYLTSPEFRSACDDAIQSGIDILEAEARRRAMAGSDILLIFMLKGARPEKYRDSYTVHNTTTPTDYVIDLTLPSGEAQPADGATTKVLE
jgi:hypothetical protein